MIIDRRENAPKYFGISPALDIALAFVRDMDTAKLEMGSRVELDGQKVYHTTMEVALSPKPMHFEYHQKYIDIHLPITGKEQIALCSAAARPSDATFDPQRDVGFFDGQAVNIVTVPQGWFCLCLPDDAHVPGMGEEGHSIVKVVVKIIA